LETAIAHTSRAQNMGKIKSKSALLAEPIIKLGSEKHLSELFEALQKNFDDGHDNDGFCALLVDWAFAKPSQCKMKLEMLLASPDFKHRDHAEWLLEYCE
jgi:hypothetical protein